MKQYTIWNVVIIDKSKLECFIAEKLIKGTGKFNVVRSFETIQTGIEYIKSTQTKDGKTLVLINIQMPGESFSDFMKELELLDETAQMYYKICPVSSNDGHDFEIMKSFKGITQFLNKPLNKTKILSMCEADK